jgi:hypothetical protein
LVKAPLAYLLVYRIGPSFCCRPPRKHRLGAELWRTRPAVPNIPFKTKERATTFFAKGKEKNSTDIAPKNPNQAIVSIDNDDFPLPILLVKRKGKWYFDTKAGRQEILSRRIGASELTSLRCIAALWKHKRSTLRKSMMIRRSMSTLNETTPRFEVKAPAKAPNVVMVLLDDVGFAVSSAFGGPINMPTLNGNEFGDNLPNGARL